MKRSLIAAAAFAVAAGCFAASPGASFGDNVGTVNAKVTVAAPCLTLSTTTIDFGTITFNTDPPTGTSGNSAPNYTITNCGAVGETLYAKGTDAASTSSNATWSLVDTGTCAAGPNTYNLSVTRGSSDLIWLTKQNQAFATALAGTATDTIFSGITSPCVGSAGAGETMTMQIVYTAAF